MKKKLLKKYNEFIKEDIVVYDVNGKQIVISESDVKKMIADNKRQELIELRDTFSDDIIGVTENFSTLSFSDLCKRENAKPEEDYQYLQSELEKKGWTFEIIKLIFSEEANKITGRDFFEWYKSTRLDSTNGFCDVYLYFTADKLGLDKNKIFLGGDGWALFNDADEIIIRYKYGYHQTPYGQLYINEIPGLVEKYHEVALTYLQDDLKENWLDIIGKSIKIAEGSAQKYDDSILTKAAKSYAEQFITINEFTVVEEDRLIIFCQDIADSLNSRFETYLTGEQVSSQFIAYLKWVPTEVQYVDSDLIIWSKFDINK